MRGKILLLILFPITAFGQSSFEKDGRIWVTKEPTNATVKNFYPLDNVYQCHGTFIKIITDTIYTKKDNVYTLYFGKDWCRVKAETKMLKIDNEIIEVGGFNTHIMFRVMSACFDTSYVYCQCGCKFKIISHSYGNNH